MQKVKNEWSSMVVQLFAQNGFGVLSSTIGARLTEEEALNNPSISRWGVRSDQLLGLDMLKEIDWADSENVDFWYSYGAT